MLATIIALTVAAQNPAAAEIRNASSGKVSYRVCRYLIQGASASGDVKICRTKAEWRQWEMCNSPTSYCSAAQKAERYGRPTAFALSEDSRVICRVVKGTGSRLRTTQLCLPHREWQRMWDDSRATVLGIQNYSKVRNGGGD